MANRLNPASPADTAFVGDGAGEIREVKTWITDVFPNVDGEITKPSDYGPSPGSLQPTEADFSQLFTDISGLSGTVGGIGTGIVPIGTVAMWSGTLTGGDTSGLNAKGWYVCDGTNGTPNLTGKFIKGATGGTLDTTGGASAAVRTTGTYQVGNSSPKTIVDSISLTEANIPAHTHYAVNADAVSPHSDSNEIGSGREYLVRKSSGGSTNLEYALAGSNTAPTTGKTSSWGNSSVTPVEVNLDATEFAHEHEIAATDIEPAHYLLYYIIYKGTA